LHVSVVQATKNLKQRVGRIRKEGGLPNSLSKLNAATRVNGAGGKIGQTTLEEQQLVQEFFHTGESCFEY